MSKAAAQGAAADVGRVEVVVRGAATAVAQTIFFNFSFIFLPSVKMHTAQSLPSVRQKALGKAGFAVPLFAESSLPSATLGKPYAECNRAFAECS